MTDVTKGAPSDLPGADLLPESLERLSGPTHRGVCAPVGFGPHAGAGADASHDELPSTPRPGSASRPAGETAVGPDVPSAPDPDQRPREADGADAPAAGASAGRAQLVGNRYRIVGPAGVGASANVYKGVHLFLGRTFAIKAVHPGAAINADLETFFLREARVLSQLHHPNIIQVTDFGTDARFGAYLVAEYLIGETLKARLARAKRLSEAFSLHLGLQIAEALHYLHQQELIHCDIKPDNVFLCDPPRGVRQRPIAKLIDFGLATSFAKGASAGEGRLGGTPLYAAPEQLAGEPPHPSMDIYAVGTQLYEMLTGRLPFEGSITEIARAKGKHTPPPPSAILNKPLDVRLEEVIMRALATDPAARQANMGRLVFEIRTLMDMFGIHRSSGRLGSARAPPGHGARRRRARAFVERSAQLATPFPEFRVDHEARICAASPAFSRLVGASPDSVLGQRLASTRLGNIYPDVDKDLLAAIAAGDPLQRTIAFTTEEGDPAAVLIWVVPRQESARSVGIFAGIIVPLPRK